MQNIKDLAGWQSGYAAACKAVYAGSIPTPASMSNQCRPIYIVTGRNWSLPEIYVPEARYSGDRLTHYLKYAIRAFSLIASR